MSEEIKTDDRKWILVWESNFLHDNKWAETDEILRLYAESKLDGAATFTTHFDRIEVGDTNRLVAIIYQVKEITTDKLREQIQEKNKKSGKD